MKSLAYIPASDGSGDASLMTITQVRTAPATSITVNTVAGVPNKFFGAMGTPHTFTDPVTGEIITVISESTAVNFAGHVDSGKIEIDAIADGEADLGSKVGDIIIIRPTTQWADNLHNVLAESHNDDGSLKDDIVTTAKLADVSVTSDKIDFATLAARQTVDANGWKVRDFGAWKEYSKIGTSVTVDALGNTGASLAGNYPVGVTQANVTSGDAILSATIVSNDSRTNETRVTFSVKTTSTNITCGLRNDGASGQWFSGKAHFRIVM